MTDLLSFLNSETLEKEFSKVLCYYINNSDETQILHVMNESDCDFGCIALPKERILFTALPELYLNVHSSRPDDTILRTISCTLLDIHKDHKQIRRIK